MKRGWHMHVLLLAVAIAACGMGDARAQNCNPRDCRRPPSGTTLPPIPPPSNNNNNNNDTPWYVLGGIVAPIIGVGIVIHFLPDNGPGSTVVQRTFPREPFNAQPPSNGPGGPGGGGGPGAGGGPVGPPLGPLLRSSFNLPARGAPYVLDQVIADAPMDVIAAAAARHNMTVLQSSFFPLINSTLHLLHIDNGASVPAAITDMAADTEIRGGQANFIFRLAQSDEALINADQYAPQKLNLAEAHRIARGNRVLIAVIDSEGSACSLNRMPGAARPNTEARVALRTTSGWLIEFVG
jgi:hypothetical protein